MYSSVLVTAPDLRAANEIGQLMVERGLAACVNIWEVLSIYRWQGRVESATEIPLLIKSTAARYPALQETIRTLHPYEIPEIIAVPIIKGSREYINWLNDETGSK